MRNSYKILSVLLCGSLWLSAQTQKVSGVVYDEDNNPLPGVSVLLKDDSTKGCLTDIDGKYTISVKRGSVLVFSYVGYSKQELAAGGDKLDVTLSSGVALESVQIVGSRNPNRTATETPVPVDVIGISGASTSMPQVNIGQILNYVAPSFSSNVQNIADGSDHVDPASLRGLGPDQLLVMVNGKRRHTSSLVNVNGSFGRGNVGTDLNAIPTAAIERIEVLRDGAAAQYGSDAIAGVMNIVLKNRINQLDINVTTGTNATRYANKQTGGFDGEAFNVSANYGVGLGKKGGFLNFTGDFNTRNYYNRMKEEEGTIFNGYNAVEWQANKDGFDLSKLQEDIPAIKKYADQVTYFGTSQKQGIQNATTIPDLQKLLEGDVTNNELGVRGLNRSDFNLRLGQSEQRGGRFFANFELPLDESGTTVYAFSGLSYRSGLSGGFYRQPSQNRTYTPAYINGFLPKIGSDIVDKSLSVGIRGKVGNWNTDFSNTYGSNSFLYTIQDTFNTSLGKASPNKFDAGGYSFLQNTTNLDVSRKFDVLEGLNIAFGSEYRIENYEIYKGEEQSYGRYAENGQLITTATQNTPVDFFGRSRPGGAQVFPGFSPANELSRGRNSIAAYLDTEADITKSLLVSAAARYENYSDFGPTLNFRLASRIKVGSNFNIRMSGNTGFRAPSLPQLYFNSTSTQFTNGVASEVGFFSNDSRTAKLLGIPQLKQETSKSVSMGFASKIPTADLTITADTFFIAIDDRVVLTGEFEGTPTTTELNNLLMQANANVATFFANAVDTQSSGVEVVISHNLKIGANWKLRTDLSGIISKTERVGQIKASKVLANAGLTSTYFPEYSRIFLEQAVPRTKGNLSFALSSRKFDLFLRNAYFGEVTEAVDDVNMQQVFSPKIVTDLTVGYRVLGNSIITIGANNLFDIYPDQMAMSFPNATGNNRDNGHFPWSRTATQFGIGGRNIFARLTINIK